MTWIISAFTFGYAAEVVLFGPPPERYGRWRVLVTGMLVPAVVILLTASAFRKP
ncbi:hypothetical protein AB0B25_12420 [Nocardia sp. NPDC049190]|uniref:hypothetical protein n=1 Tax=Nocardia sp. NPDC049190 TaxID=3155650 RepID=UPI0034069C33